MITTLSVVVYLISPCINTMDKSINVLEKLFSGEGVLSGVAGKHNYPKEINTVSMKTAYPEDVPHSLIIPFKNTITEQKQEYV